MPTYHLVSRESISNESNESKTQDSVQKILMPTYNLETRTSIPTNDLKTRNSQPTINLMPTIDTVNLESRITTTTMSLKHQIIPIIITENDDRRINDNDTSDTDDDFSFDEVFVADEESDIEKRRQNSDILSLESAKKVSLANINADTASITCDNPSTVENNDADILTSISSSSSDSDTSSVSSDSSINLVKFRRRLREKSNNLKGRLSSGAFVYNNTWENVGLPHKPTCVFFKDFDRPVTDDVSAIYIFSEYYIPESIQRIYLLFFLTKLLLPTLLTPFCYTMSYLYMYRRRANLFG